MTWLKRKEEAGVSKIAPITGEKKNFEGCWAAAGHGVEVEVAGIHSGGDG